MSRSDRDSLLSESDRDSLLSQSDQETPLLAGAVVGVLAWLVGYVLVYAAVGSDVRASRINRVVQALGGDPATYELVGWVFYNAHLVDTVFSNVPVVGGSAANYIGGDGFTVLLYGVPVLTLGTAGFLLARYADATAPMDGAVAGLTALPGYLLPSLIGVFLFEVTIGGASGAPDTVSGIVRAGLLYPVVFAGGGGVLGGLVGGS